MQISISSADATLKAISTTIKGEVVTTLGTPAGAPDGVSLVAGSVTITPTEATNITDVAPYVTLFDKTNTGAEVKVVKYTPGPSPSASAFEADAAYANEAITNLNFFIIRVIAQDGSTVLYYKVVVTVTISQLAAARVAALTALTAAFASYTEANYTAENWTTLITIKAAGDAAIEAATNVADVTSAQATALVGMAGVEVIDLSLDTAKVAAHTALAAAFSSYPVGTYIAEDLATLITIKAAGDAAIEAATSVADVTSNQDTALAGMATISQLAAARVAALTALTAAFASYTEANYTAENWTTLITIKVV